MLGSYALIAFLATRQPERAKAFYQSVLGLALVSDDPFALVFDAGGTMLRVAKVEKVTPAAHTVLGWNVPDIREAMRQLSGKGVTFERYPGLSQDGCGIWTTPEGHNISWFKDPDGNVLSLTQFRSE